MSLDRILLPIFVILTIANFCICSIDKGRLQTRTSLFGEHCNKTLRCKSRSGLVCDTNEGNVCRCARRDETVYEPAQEQCVALIGKKCILGYDSDRGISIRAPEGVGCVTLGECDFGTRLCKCTSQYYPVGTACHPRKVYNSPCENTSECGESLSCNNGTCSCNSGREVYNEESFTVRDGFADVPGNRCTKRVGEICTDRMTIMWHRPDRTSDPPTYCARNAICSGGTSTCIEGHSPTLSNLCGIGHGAACTNHLSSTCRDALLCSDGVCTCPNPDFETYDPKVELCRRNIGVHCDANKTSACVQGAVCVYDDDQDDFHCNCEVGSVQVDATTCQKEFGQPCRYSSPEAKPPCDSMANLVCKMGNCQCKNVADIYEPERQQCSTPVGFPCQENANCVSNAVCKKIFPTERGDFGGRCKCLDGFEKTQNRSCVKLSITLPILSTNLQTTAQPDIKVSKNDIEVAPTSQEYLKDESTLQ